jgi:macrodomain Ter protein organizer (MatP/YcbG family)
MDKQQNLLNMATLFIRQKIVDLTFHIWLSLSMLLRLYQKKMCKVSVSIG